MLHPAINLTNDIHHGNALVSLRFEKEHGLIIIVTTLPGATWSQSRKFWHIAKSYF